MNRNAIKFIAAATMTIDHIGVIFLVPGSISWFVLRSIGRIAFVLFAYMIAEGFNKSSNRIRYFLRLLGFALLIEMFFVAWYFINGDNYTIFGNSTPENVIWPLVFGLASLMLIYNRAKNYTSRVLISLSSVILVLVSIYLNIPYAGYGVLMIIFFGIYKNPLSQFLFVLGLNLLFIDAPMLNYYNLGSIARYQGDAWFQWFSMLAFVFIFLYNGQKGKWNTKWFFYIFYPLHLALLYAIDYLLGVF